MDVTEYISHPERLDRDSLYELRSLLALYPYYQTARILLLQNLYLLHDASFDEELRRAAIYIADRRVLFQMIEAGHYQLPADKPAGGSAAADADAAAASVGGDRTITLIDSFLSTIPKDDDYEHHNKQPRKPTPADAAVDYVAYLMESDENWEEAASATPLRGQGLIDSFLENEGGRITLPQSPKGIADSETQGDGNDVRTEALARIYIKQAHYEQARDIILQLKREKPLANGYYDDQLRFLDKLIINERAGTKS
ncbi:MAG: tetratricopeptide repeat protein [Prevotella sp.]|nr:tetratricopeptide repeat protein [Prevotella sp.]